MGSSGALVCSAAFVLVLLSSASNDEHNWEQREITFDIDKIVQEMQEPDYLFQKEADLTDLIDPKGASRPGVLTPRGSRPSFRPGSFSGPPSLNYPVQFPLGRPTADNLQAICLHGDHRPRYPGSYFPSSGFGQLVRRANAVNMAESWFSMCCKGNQTWDREVTLCCATQAWELSVQSFCEEDSSVKDRLYYCCRLRDMDRLNCFHNDAPNPNYEATEELPVPPLSSTTNFNFDSNTCQRRKEKKINIHFPPGRPTADVIESLCRNQKLRPIYKANCLSGEGYQWVVRQAKAINRIEKGFKQCCKKKQDVLNCADLKWRDELNKYCVGENSGNLHSLCCSGELANERYSCFQDISPDPYYNRTSVAEELSLNKLCDYHKIIKNKFPVGFPLKSFIGQCCHRPFDIDVTICFEQSLDQMSETCSSRKASPPAVRRCCRMSSPQQCISKILMDAITKATVFSQKKKRCPLA
ncbi:extracellular matrix protein 1-like isoform X2 [Sander lucioperca]|uniref:extracellular matrix protein 1-like isoform X2 n=1 Tax=Sander lucioperca TaxID=283035 RepID=UPI001653BAB7|nr:extracellular matrix protein 1-like isoform X2 [Sander lucioperca]